jgi:hypothetical protein
MDAAGCDTQRVAAEQSKAKQSGAQHILQQQQQLPRVNLIWFNSN